MIFTSLTFIIFAILFFILYSFFKKNNLLRYVLIIIASFIFYGWWDWRYLFLIIFTGTIDFSSGILIDKYQKYKKIFLIFSIFCNLSILFSFKYLVWLMGVFLTAVVKDPSLTAQTILPGFLLVLPVGISFYTFQSMSYTIDVYRGDIRPTKNYLQYFCYLSMFPQLVAGPIVRARDVLAQMERPSPLTGERLYDGLIHIGTGFFKKAVIADTLAPYVNRAFAGHVELDATGWWLIILAFSIQIYCDFSGYSDIAIGLARWMGIDFKSNFNFPYHAVSPSDFWKRWHISLSSWFKDYVYISLGGSRVSKVRTLVNLWITMLLSGLWHGAAWNFLAWGGFHALLLSLHRVVRKWSLPCPHILKIFLTFFFVLLGWIFFRSNDMKQAFKIFSIFMKPSLYSWNPNFQDMLSLYIIISSFFIFNFCMLSEKFRELKEKYEPLFLGIMIFCCIFYRGNGDAFIYFQF